ncbi:MAG: 2-amino-4-hydroxy-6-hydroxymethyldihydropteridine diphosphokinase [Pelagibacterales bacterium MED-G44]|nr:MAG: 2-amino-4-hydroxy-6-hydroxymethyldihydropteridine diphosphokinase [Pelagibacterales bacterium MED-G44]
MSENPVKVIYLGIGSNLGNRKKNIEMTKFKLVANNVEIIKTSSYYESLSWPNQNNPKFINIIVKVKTHYTPLELIQKCQNIEKEMGRKKSPKNSPRVCDIDIIDYKNKEINRGLILPHPRMHTRNFVLLPLFEIDKDWKHPVLKHNIKKLILSLSNSDIRSIKQI